MRGWGWYALLYKLADGKYLQLEAAGNTNFIGALNFLAYQRSQENYINALKEQNQTQTQWQK